MSRKIWGRLSFLLGILISLFSIFSDPLRGRPQSLGPAQIALLFAGLGFIFLGIFLLWNIKISKVLRACAPFPNQVLSNVILLVLIALLLFFPLRYIIGYLSSPYPMEYRDAASLSAALDFSKGVNPYSLQNFPNHMYLYGFLYPLIIVPFVNLVPHLVMIPAYLDLFFLVLILGLSFWIFRKLHASISSSLIGLLIFLNSFCIVWKFNGSRPDASGLFFALLGLFFLLKAKLKNIDLLLCALFCVISFYLKQYMLFSAAVLAAYLFLSVSKKKGILFMGAVFTMGVLSFLVTRHFFPLYYEYSIMHHINVAGHNISYLEEQSRLFMQYYWVLFVVYLFYLVKMLTGTGFKKLKGMRILLNNFDAPLLQGVTMDLFDIGILISTCLLVVSLGKHNGNLYTYYIELLLPFLLYKIIPQIDGLFNTNFLRFSTKLLILAFCVFPLRTLYATDFSQIQGAFSKVYEYADHCVNIDDETPLVAVYKIEHRQYPLNNNGQIEYAFSVIPDKTSIFGKISSFTPKSLEQKLTGWNEGIAEKIESQQFDCIFSESDKEIKRYTQTAKVDDVLGRTVYLYTPVQP